MKSKKKRKYSKLHFSVCHTKKCYRMWKSDENNKFSSGKTHLGVWKTTMQKYIIPLYDRKRCINWIKKQKNDINTMWKIHFDRKRKTTCEFCCLPKKRKSIQWLFFNIFESTQCWNHFFNENKNAERIRCAPHNSM